jgi:hypothetical protein
VKLTTGRIILFTIAGFVLLVLGVLVSALTTSTSDSVTAPQPMTPQAATPLATQPSATASATPAPQGEHHKEDPFWVFASSLHAALQAGDVSLLLDKLLTTTVTCREEDVPPQLGGPECFTVGDAFEGFAVGHWRSEGTIVPVNKVRDQLKYLQTAVRSDLRDGYGDGSLRVAALDRQGSARVAIITAIINSPPGFGAATIRVAIGTYWVERDREWRLASILNNYVLAGEFLDPSPAPREGLFPGWEPFVP